MNLAQAYSRIPAVPCKGLCAESCGFIPVFPNEPIVTLTNPSHILPDPTRDGGIMLFDTDKSACPHLIENRCSQYEDRPAICRMWGAAIGMECPHGCVPERWLSRKDGHALLKQAEKAEV